MQHLAQSINLATPTTRTPMSMHNPPHPGEFITEVYLEPAIIGG